ncbi:glycoside hydrolase family 88 protein [Bacteroidota bacterium]
MKYAFVLLSALVVIFTYSCRTDSQSLDLLIEEQLAFAIDQSKRMNENLPADLLPRSFNAETNELITSGSDWWCSGFYPGVLWYLYDYSKDEELLQMAKSRTALIEKEQYNTGTHDLGFMINNSYGLGLKVTGDERHKKIMLNGAYSLLSRFREQVGCIQSWDNDKWTCPVIIDNMMNLEYLVWAFNETGDSSFIHAVISHTENTIKNHFRANNSSYHLVDFDTITGDVIRKLTVQGFDDESAWARGQAWGLYGFVSIYREIGEARFLKQAVGIADFITKHENLPDNKIPYWDFDAPDIPDVKRDASAGAIICSALLELHQYVDKERSERYLSTAETILRTLSSPEYRAEAGENGNFILKHSVGHLPANSEVDVPVTYADYYFIESLLLMRELYAIE